LIHKIVVLDRSALPPDLHFCRPRVDHEWVEYDRTGPEELLARAEEADVLILNKVRLPAEAIGRLPKLRLVSVAATGTDVIDLAACHAHGVVVCNVPAYGSTTVSEHTFALLLALHRSLPAFANSVRDGGWQQARQFSYFDFPIRDLEGTTLGIVGAGTIGMAVARIAKGFGMKVLLADHKGAAAVRPGRIAFADILKRADTITLHCPLTVDTRNLIGRQEFEEMQRRPVLINTSRGELVDESSVGWALDQGLIAGAAFDVASVEPPPPEHPLMQLLGRPNFILTPHIAWASAEAAQTVADVVIANIEAFYSGAPQNQVEPR
jgi:glycerate dehydrogenase